MARYLVTGGCGFIGSHLVRALQARGARVQVLDNLSSGDRQRLVGDVELVVGDVRDAALVQSLASGMDGLFHLAAIASVEQCNRDWAGSHATNLTGTINLFEASRHAGGIPVVWASSAAVYGDQGAQPLREDQVPAPQTPYGVDKLACELHGRVAAELFAVPNFGMRFFNVYGPGQDPCSPYAGVISIFIDQALRGTRATIFGDGSATRDFVYVDDVVDALHKAMQVLQSGPRDRFGVFNVSTGHPTRVDELHRHIGKAAGTLLPAIHAPARTGEIHASTGSTDMLERNLGLRCGTPLTAGLERLVGHVMAPVAGGRR